MTLDDLMKLRRQKKRPAHMVILSLVGPLVFSNPVIEINGRIDDLDLRPLTGLEVEIAHDDRTADKALDLAFLLLPMNPTYLGTWDRLGMARFGLVLHGEVLGQYIPAWWS